MLLPGMDGSRSESGECCQSRGVENAHGALKHDVLFEIWVGFRVKPFKDPIIIKACTVLGMGLKPLRCLAESVLGLS